MEKYSNIIYGPVPSRRFGRSLGINNIPPKICSYSCIYCQIGKTTNVDVKREEYFKPQEIFKEVEEKLNQLGKKKQKVDYLSLVPDGEPTLDINLGKTIRLLKSLNIPLALITNGSLLWQEEVRNDLNEADLVSCKVDSVVEKVWKKINHPSAQLNINEILQGVEVFSREFKGELITETMLIERINDDLDQIEKNASYLSRLNLKTAFISIPTRPPANAWVRPPEEQKINQIYSIYADKIDRVELLIGYEGNDFSSTGDAEQDLLGITAVHPMREDAVKKLLEKTGSSWEVIEKLLKQEKLVKTQYNNNWYLLRKIHCSG